MLPQQELLSNFTILKLKMTAHQKDTIKKVKGQTTQKEKDQQPNGKLATKKIIFHKKGK